MSKVTVNIDADLQDLIPQFIENRKKDIATLQSLVDASDLTAIAQLAHKIKGAAAGYGFVQLSDLASEMEKAAKSGNPAPLKSLAVQMETHFSNIEVKFVSL